MIDSHGSQPVLSMSKKRYVILSVITRVIVCIVLLGIGVGLFALLFHTRPMPDRVDEDVLRPQVAVIQMQTVPVRRQFTGFGTAQAFRAVNVPAQVRGVIEDIPERIVAGNPVTRGELLAQLDASDFERELEIRTQQLEDIETQLRRLDVELRSALRRLELAQQEVELAQADLDRVLRAQETAGATQREVDQQRQLLAARQREEVAAVETIETIEPRQAQLNALRSSAVASVRLAERNLQRTTITSPIDGVLQTVNVDLGEGVAIDQTVARVVDLRRIDIPIRLPSSARPYLAVGNEVALRPGSNSNAQWQARIARIAPEDDDASRTVTVYVELYQEPTAPGGQPMLSPGQFVRAEVSSMQIEQRQVIPRRALFADRVRLIDDGVVRSRRVEVAFQIRSTMEQFQIADDHWLVLEQPLPEGSLIVLDAARRIADGTLVRPVIAAEIASAHATDREGQGARP